MATKFKYQISPTRWWSMEVDRIEANNHICVWWEEQCGAQGGAWLFLIGHDDKIRWNNINLVESFHLPPEAREYFQKIIDLRAFV